MASPGHRANVLDGRFTHGGVGAAAADGTMFQGYVQNTRMYTELFLQPPARRPAPAPAPPPSGGGGGGGGGGVVQHSPRQWPRRRPRSREPEAEADDASTAPRRPTSTAGIDGVTDRRGSARRRSTSLRASRADDALGNGVP